MELFRLLGTIAIDNTKAKEAVDETTDKAKEGANETEEAFAKIGNVASTIARGIGIAGMAIGGSLIAATEGTREYRQQMGLLDSSFKTANHSSEAAKNTYSELNALLGDSGQAVEASQHLAVLVDNEKDLQTWTDICTGVYATFGASLPIESLTEASNETAKTGILTGGLVDALNWAGISEEKFQEQLDECNSEQERQKLIMDTLNGTYKEASEQYKETNKDVLESNKAQERLTDAIAEVGAVCEPVMTRIKEAIAGMVEHIAPFLEDAITQFKDIVKWVKDNEETVKIWIGVILGATTTIGTFLLILNWGAIMSAAASAINTVKLAILGMNTAILANPIAMIVALIAGLVVAFIYLWNNCEGFRLFWINLWEAIKEAAGKAWEWIKSTFSEIGSWFSTEFDKVKKAGKDAMDSVKQWFSDAYKKITDVFSSVGSWFSSQFKSAWNGIKNAFSEWGSFFSELWGKVKNKFADIGTKIGEAISGAVKGAMNQALSKIERAINNGIKLINKAVKVAQKFGFDVGTISEISLPRLAKGAVIDKPTTAIVGEDGAEAVVPLERNTQWINKVSSQVINDLGASNNIESGTLESKVDRIISLLERLTERNIYLDTGALVGELTLPLNKELGKRYKYTLRNN